MAEQFFMSEDSPTLTMLYHKEYAVHGRTFSGEAEVQEAVKQGWVDNPAKFGHNIWTGEHSAPHIQRIKRAYDKGKIKAVDSEIINLDKIDNDELKEENEALRKQLAETADALANAKERARLNREQLQDERNDAGLLPKDKAGTKRPARRKPAAKNAPEPKAEAGDTSVDDLI